MAIGVLHRFLAPAFDFQYILPNTGEPQGKEKRSETNIMQKSRPNLRIRSAFFSV